MNFWSKHLLFKEFAEHKINQGTLYSAAIIRKIVEDEKDAETEFISYALPMAPLEILKIKVPVTVYCHIDKGKFFANSKMFLQDYDIKHAEEIEITLRDTCNQIIHSYVWNIIYQGMNKIYGVAVASDRAKEKDLFLLRINDWIHVIQEVVNKCNI